MVVQHGLPRFTLIVCSRGWTGDHVLHGGYLCEVFAVQMRIYGELSSGA